MGPPAFRLPSEEEGRRLGERIVDVLTPDTGGSGGGGGEGSPSGNPIDDATALAQQVASLGTVVGLLEAQVKEMGEGLKELATALASMNLGVGINLGLDANSISQALAALRPPDPPVVDATAAVTALTQAINEAERVLNSENFMMSTVTVNLDLNLAVGDKGVKTTLTFHVTPKPIS